jgi:hypothetical protein
MRADEPYGCHSAVVQAPCPGSVYRVQNGWTTDGRRAMAEVAVLPSVSVCDYDQRTKDRRCAQCARAQPAVAS